MIDLSPKTSTLIRCKKIELGFLPNFRQRRVLIQGWCMKYQSIIFRIMLPTMAIGMNNTVSYRALYFLEILFIARFCVMPIIIIEIWCRQLNICSPFKSLNFSQIIPLVKRLFRWPIVKKKNITK